QDLDSLPFIDRDILYEQKSVFKKDISILTGRGCPYSCTFCASDALNRVYKENSLGKSVRQRSIESVLNELIFCKRKYSPRSVYFTDDVFTLSVDWLRSFAPEYKSRIALPFYCTANPGTIKNEELYLLKEAGCQMIGFGMQSCNEEYRNKYLKRRGTNDRIKEVANLCHSLKIHFSFDHIFNLPNEPKENQKEAIKFYKETRPDIINTFNMTYLPKIELNKYLDDETREEVEKGNIRTTMFNKQSKLLFWIQLIKKDIKRLLIGRYSDVFFPIRLLLINIRDNILIKCGLR
ncbi:MAG: radical SAM protein, partial [Nanoarchaeota archaeon]